MLNSLQNCRCSLIFTILLAQKNPPIQTPPKFFLANSHLPILPLIVHEIILTMPNKTPFFYSPALFHLSIFAYSDPYNLHQKYFHYLSYLANSGCVKGPIIRKSCEYWHCFNFCLYPQSIDRGHKSHDHWFLIAKAQKIDVLQIFMSDENVCNRNRKPSNPPSPVPSIYCHYLHTLLITSQELTFPYKPVA